MKKLLGILTAILMTTTSQASMLANGNEHFGKLIPIVTQHRIVTRNVPAYVSVPRIPKFKVLRGNPHRISYFLLDDSEDSFIDDDGIMTPYRRRDLAKIKHPDGLSNNVKWRLFLARQLALLKYKEKWAMS